MGNSESNPPKAQQGNIPQQAPVLAPYNGYNYYQNQYWPQLYDYSNYPGYGYAMYPAYYPAYYNDQPAGSNEKDISKRVHSQTRKKDNVPTDHRHDQQPVNANSHSNHRHHAHSPHRHQSSLPPESERLSPSLAEKPPTSSRPPLRPPSLHPPPSVQAQNPVSTVTTIKIASAVPNKEISYPAPPIQVQNPTSAVPHKEIVSPSPAYYSPSAVANHPSPSGLVQPHRSAIRVPNPNSFEKAPIIETNYIPKPYDDNSIQSYGPGTLSVARRTSSNPGASGHRWYDHNYDKRVKPLTAYDE